MYRLKSISQQSTNLVLSTLWRVRDNGESLISFPRSLHFHILKPDNISQCAALSITPFRRQYLLDDWEDNPTLNKIDVLVNCSHSSAELAWHGGVYLRSADTSLLAGSCCCYLCSSVLVLAQDSMESCSVWASPTLFYHSCRLSGARKKYHWQRWAALSALL